MESIINSPGMWIACSFMVIVILAQSILFIRLTLTEAKKLNIPDESVRGAIRSAAVTSVGPVVGVIVVLMAMIHMTGTPNAWMRVNDIGAPATELMSIAIGSEFIGVKPNTPGFDIRAFSYACWAQAFNNMGFMVVALLITGKMGKTIIKLNKKYHPMWIKLIMLGSALALFTFMITSSTIGKDYTYAVSVIVSAVSILAISRCFGDNPRLQEFSLGLSMVLGMAVATIMKYNI